MVPLVYKVLRGVYFEKSSRSRRNYRPVANNEGNKFTKIKHYFNYRPPVYLYG